MVLFSRVPAPDWESNDPVTEAKCRHLPTPRPGTDPFFEDEKQAMAVCNGQDDDASYPNAGTECPQRAECLVFALINHEGSGVWGGMLLHDRMNLKRNVPRVWWKWHPPTPKPVDLARQDDVSRAA